jgi:SAM-dependent methyltransferase
MTTNPIANVDQHRAWSGPEGEHWAAHADRHDAAVAAHHARLLAAAAIRDGEAVVDLGCGNGQTTCDAASASPAGHALGLDLSRPMLAVAVARAAARGLANVRFLEADVQVHPFEPASFDVAVSRFAISFCGDVAAGLANVGRALRAGGRFATITWTALERNEWLTAVRAICSRGRDLPGPPPAGVGGPFGLGDVARTRAWLADAGFGAIELEEVRLPMVLGTDADAALVFFGSSGPVAGMLGGLDGPDREAARRDLHALFTDRTTERGVELDSSAWLVTATKQ